MSTLFDLRNPNRKIHIGVLLPNTTTELLDVAPVEVFSAFHPELLASMPPQAVSPKLVDQAIDSEIHWVTENGKDVSRLSSNLKVLPTNSIKDCPELDILVMGAAMMGYTWSQPELEFILKTASSNAAVVTVCGGFQSLLEAGLLQGKTATAPNVLLPILRETAPGTNWVEKRWVQDGNLWTSGALLNGIDLMAAFVRHTWGHGERKELVERMLEFGGWNTGRSVDY